jgi:hypothetical protein
LSFDFHDIRPLLPARLQLLQCLSDKRRIWPDAQTVLTPGQMVFPK